MTKTDWGHMSLKDFLENGLLYKVNQEVLWPLGIALAFEVDENKQPTGHITVLTIDDEIEDFDPDREIAFADFALARWAEMFDAKD